MAISRGSYQRQLIPRWRPWRITAALGELASNGPARVDALVAQRSTHSLESLGFAFRKSRTIHHAADLVGAALVIGERPTVAVDAAQYLVEHVSQASPQRDAALTLLAPDERRLTNAYKQTSGGKMGEATRARIAKLKMVLHNEPRNAVRWVDLARDYLILGQDERARRSMEAALHLDPNNRFILRAAVKLFEHQRDFSRAQTVLESASRTRSDPWLVAAAVAIADLRGVSSRFVRIARDMSTTGDIVGLPLAEVAAAMSMVEWRHGSDRRARQLARTALILPTDNVLAQFEWAREKGFQNFGSEAGDATPRRFEAESRRLAAVLAWDEAVEQADLWLRDEPFSVDAAMHGSWAAAASGEYATAERFTRAGQEANRGDVGLANNLACALAQQGRLDEAADELRRAAYLESTPRQEAFLTATKGLVLFRGGQHDEGRRNYITAYEVLSRLDSPDAAATALIILAEEEMRAGSACAASAMSRAERAVRGIQSAVVQDRWTRLEAARRASAAQPGLEDASSATHH